LYYSLLVDSLYNALREVHFMTIKEAVNRRQSVRQYQPNQPIDPSIIKEILTVATRAPSSWNLQPWRFVVIQSEELKQLLRPYVLFNTPQLDTSGALILVLNDLKRYALFPIINQQDLDAGYVTHEQFLQRQLKADQAQATRTKESLAREGLFDCGLVSSHIMLVAQSYGLDSCAMGGFDRDNFMNVLHLDTDRYQPVVLLSLGVAQQLPKPSLRLPIDKIVEFK
jgi:nitroreductase